MLKIPPPKFALGRLVATPAAMAALEESNESPWKHLFEHMAGRWGNVCPEDQRLNDMALESGDRLLSSYTTAKGTRIWVLTEAEDDSGKRPLTTILLPEDY
jgi:hypothetical protein